MLLAGPGCDPRAPASVSCDLIAKGEVTPIVTKNPMPSQQKDAPTADVCEAQPSSGPTPTGGTVEALTPLQRGDLLEALDNYTSALAAITNAKDRADFDAAASKASAAIGALVQSGATASGVAAAAAPIAGNLAKASSNAVLWLVGQALDYQRLQQLRITTEAACQPMHILAIALQFAMEEQRGDDLDQLRNLLDLNLQIANRTRVTPHVSDQTYGTTIDNAQAAADAFQTVRNTNPQAMAQALSDSHDALVVAVRNNSGSLLP